MRYGHDTVDGHIADDVFVRLLSDTEAMSPERYAALFQQAREREDIVTVLADHTSSIVDCDWEGTPLQAGPSPRVTVRTARCAPEGDAANVELALAA
jgi:hypothetical protein